MDVGQNTTLGDGDVSEQLVQLLIVADGELQVTGDDTGLLVVASSVASQLKNLSREVLEDGSQVDWSTSTDTLGVVALAKQTVNTTDGERQTSLGGTAVEGACQWVDTNGRGCNGAIATRPTAQIVFGGGGGILTTERSWSR